MEETSPMFRPLAFCAVGATAVMLTGCSLFVMAGKMLFDDPKMACAFKQATHVDLQKEQSRVLVIASTPETVRADWTSLSVDLLEGVTRLLKSQGINVVNPDDVATWLDDNGGTVDEPTELANHFRADYIVHINIERFSFYEDSSPTLYRGRTNGFVTAFQVQSVNGQKVARHVFEREFTSEYPEHHPVSKDSISEKVFLKRYMDRVCAQLSYLFYDHRFSEEIH